MPSPRTASAPRSQVVIATAALSVGALCFAGGTALADQVATTLAQAQPVEPVSAPPPAVSGARAVLTPPPAAPVVRTAPVVPEWLSHLNIGGGAILWLFQPVDTGAKRNVDLFFANILLDGKFGAVGLHIEPRFRDSRLRTFFPGPVWAQEAYASVRLAPGTVIKAGKEYSHFGLFWDNSFYGNVQVYDGLKLDPDYGLSLEGTVAPDAPAGLRYYAQYFVVDGGTNVSLSGRDTISVPTSSGGFAQRRNQTILRVEPFFKINEDATLTAGLSGAYLQAALPIGNKNVYRGAADASIAVRRFAAWAEYTYQNGQSVTDFPIAGAPATATTPATPGQASSHNHYVLAGAQLSWRAITARYNVSTGRYSDLSISEWMHVPALAVAVGDNLTILGEYVDWRRYAPSGSSFVDRSVNVTLNGHF